MESFEPVWKRRVEKLMVVAAAGAGAVLLFVLALWTYMSATATPVHPDPDAVPSVASPEAPPEWAEAAGESGAIARTALTSQNLPGLSVAVGAGGRLVWAGGFGWADVEARVPVTPGTQFRIGTASTVLTSAGVGWLLDHDRLRLDAPIDALVPAFPRQTSPVTLRQVMAHLAGIGSDGGDEGPLLARHCTGPADALPAVAERPLLFDPGTAYRFSNYGWIAVSAAVETAAGEPFDRFMRNVVFEPIGMDGTRPDRATDDIADRAASYFPRFAADPRYGLDPMRPIDLSCYAGAGAFLSTAPDLVRFALAMNAGTVVRPGTVAELRTSQRLPSGEETGYGLGWDLEDVTLGGAPTRLAGHDGDVLGGPVASLMTFPDGLVVAVLSNASYADTFGIGLAIAQAFTKGTVNTEGTEDTEGTEGTKSTEGAEGTERASVARP
ncbi:MAG: serine hydrolase domain-containing protein [Vicinamibacterales bacterium]